jgi:membrane-bound ClpP family serine protease
MDQVIQVVGAILILAAFILTQMGRISMDSYPYLYLNAAGAGILAVEAFRNEQWGFVLLEGVWFLVTLWSLIRARKDPKDARTSS